MPRAIERAPARTGRDKTNAEAGFTLLEAMVAFVVLATLLSVTFRSVVQNRAGASVFAAHMREDLLVRAVLDQVLARREFKVDTYRGEIKGHRWVAQVAPADSLMLKKAERPAPGGPPGAQTPQADQRKPGTTADWIPYRVNVRIADGERLIRLETLQLGKAPPRGATP